MATFKVFGRTTGLLAMCFGLAMTSSVMALTANFESLTPGMQPGTTLTAGGITLQNMVDQVGAVKAFGVSLVQGVENGGPNNKVMSPGNFGGQGIGSMKEVDITVDSQFMGVNSLDLQLYNLEIPGYTGIQTITIEGTFDGVVKASAQVSTDGISTGFVELINLALATESTLFNGVTVRSESGDLLCNIDNINANGIITGDINYDGVVDIFDVLQGGENYGRADATYAEGDANMDTYVDIFDVLLTGEFYGQSAPVIPAGEEAPVPEPTTLAMFGAVAGLMALRRR